MEPSAPDRTAVSNTGKFRPHITPVPDRLKGKAAFITGAARGIGKAIALRFAQEGASIAIVDRDAAAARQCRREVESIGVSAVDLQADVADRNDVQRAAESARNELGGIDIAVNNAGVIVFGSLLECRLADWDRMIAVDLTGALHVTQIVGRMMVEQNRGGRLIHVGSTASLLPTAKQAAYCVAKAGLLMMSRLAALELVDHGITSNLLCPQGAVTDINRELLSDPAVMQALEDNIPAHRMSTVEEIAACAAFLASDEAAYITGTELVHDGGSVISALWWR